MMKHSFFAFALSLLLVSCNNGEEFSPGGNDDGKTPDTEQVCPKGAVDLGLVLPRLDKDGNPVKDANGKELQYHLYWAESNLSENGLCSHSYDFGDYFAWAETAPYYAKFYSQAHPCYNWRSGKTGYNWDSYAWANGAYDKLTKYCPKALLSYWDKGVGSDGPDDKTDLSDYNYEDDAARAILHGKWRTPTLEEWKALLKFCTISWPKQNDVHGLTLTAPNGKQIFLPGAGAREYENLVLMKSGSYWASSINDGAPNYAWILEFGDNGGDNGVAQIEQRWRHQGMTIRPVSE